MGNNSIEVLMDELKSAATSQTEVVQGLMLVLMGMCQKIDGAIEEYGDDRIKEELGTLLQDLPEILMAISMQVDLIHPSNNQIS